MFANLHNIHPKRKASILSVRILVHNFVLNELLGMTIMPTPKAIRMAAGVYSIRFEGPLLRLLVYLRPFICPFWEMLRFVPFDQNVLDVGCGNGLWLYLINLYRRPAMLSGVDANKQKIKAAKNALINTNVPTILTVAEKPSYWPEGQYDVVSLIDVLHHIPPGKQESFFVAVADRVAKGGVLIYKDMCNRPMWRSFANIVHDLVFARQLVHHVDIRDVEVWAAHAGLCLDGTIDKATYCYGHEIRCFARPK